MGKGPGNEVEGKMNSNRGGGGGEGTTCDGLNGEAAPESDTILALQVYKRTGTS